MKTKDISIIIRTLNEGRYLDDLLEGIKAQKINLNFEIIIVDSGSIDETLNIANKHNCKILNISRDEFSFGRSLNRGCEIASGKYFVLISGHCIPFDEYWLKKLIHPLKTGLTQYCYGRQIGGPNTFWSEHQIFSKYFPQKSKLPQKGFYCNNANSALLSAIWKKYKFDEELTGLEDMHLAKRLVHDGNLIGYIADACVYHLHNESWPQIQRRFEREALALQEICPEVLLSRINIVRYLMSAIIRDLKSGISRTRNLRFVLNIFRYRYNQYIGSWKGNHLHKKISRQLRDSYFYPTLSKGEPLTLLKKLK